MGGFRHVVLFTWTEGTTTSQRDEAAARLAELPGKIPEILSYSIGGDAGINPGTYDFVVVADFADRESYVAYRDHPEHRSVVERFISPVVDRRAAIQYET